MCVYVITCVSTSYTRVTKIIKKNRERRKRSEGGRSKEEEKKQMQTTFLLFCLSQECKQVGAEELLSEHANTHAHQRFLTLHRLTELRSVL